MMVKKTKKQKKSPSFSISGQRSQLLKKKLQKNMKVQIVLIKLLTQTSQSYDQNLTPHATTVAKFNSNEVSANAPMAASVDPILNHTRHRAF